MGWVVVLPRAPAALAWDRRAQESPELVALGSWLQELLLHSWEGPDLQSQQCGWGAVLVQSRNSWKHYEFPDGLMAHLMEVKEEARHWSDLFCFFRGECVKGDALVMC